ncbi:hypothetical protein LTSERUB_5066, partial [Salmonella enterica subsp. enterica serovar Rubislaw str. A4-653]
MITFPFHVVSDPFNKVILKKKTCSGR